MRNGELLLVDFNAKISDNARINSDAGNALKAGVANMEPNSDELFVSRIIKRLSNPKYTGENRCELCTVVNLSIATVLSIIVGSYSVPLGISVLLASILMIYLNGYLIPRTPEITKRYFPPWLRNKFHGDRPYFNPFIDNIYVKKNKEKAENPYEFLHRVGLIEPCTFKDDVCLEKDFKKTWLDFLEDIDKIDIGLSYSRFLDVEEDKLSIGYHSDSSTLAFDDKLVGQWESEDLMRIDMATIESLQAYCPRDWYELSWSSKTEIIGSLRLFIDNCPICGTSISEQYEEIETCCGSDIIMSGICSRCDMLIYEFQDTI